MAGARELCSSHMHAPARQRLLCSSLLRNGASFSDRAFLSSGCKLHKRREGFRTTQKAAGDFQLSSADLPPEPRQDKSREPVNVFPKRKERDPYRLLGVDQSATFDEVQDARNYLYEQYKSHEASREAIEMAFDTILQQRMKARHKYGFRPPRTGRATDAAPEVKVSFWQQVKDKLEPDVPFTTLVNDGVIFLALGLWSAWQYASMDPTLPLAASFGYCLWKLFDKRSKRNPEGPYWGNSPIWGALGTTIIGVLVSQVIILAVAKLVNPFFPADVLGVLILSLTLGVTCIFVK